MDDPLYVELMEAYHVALDRGKHGGRISLSLEAQACLAPGVRALVLGTEEAADAAAWEEDEEDDEDEEGGAAVEGMGADVEEEEDDEAEGMGAEEENVQETEVEEVEEEAA